jgi:DNA-binding CsgD family transcriptional regulator
MGLALGAGKAQAEDAASVVVLGVRRSWTGWAAAENEQGYLRKAVRYELGKIGKRRVAEQVRELRYARELLPAGRRNDSHELVGVRQALTIMTPRQREIIGWLYVGQLMGWDPRDIADELDIHPDTIRRHRKNVRDVLGPVLTGGDDRLRLRAAQRAHEAWHRGEPSPFGPRPTILKGWMRAHELKLARSAAPRWFCSTSESYSTGANGRPFHNGLPFLTSCVT